MNRNSENSTFEQRLLLIHCFTQIDTIGGVESVLGQHRALDRSKGIESHFILYTELGSLPDGSIHRLEYRPSDPIRTLCHRLAAVCEAVHPEFAVYHLIWSIRELAGCDRCSRRILMIHGDVASDWDQLRTDHVYFDGIICVNTALQKKAAELLPDFGRERLISIATPISPPSDAPILKGILPKPVIGYAGRLTVESKRIDRIPAFCRALTLLGLEYELEIAGEGPDAAALSSPEYKPWSMLGALRGRNYWETLRRWDLIVFFSDREGTPMALLEALSQGILPIFPRIESGGDDYVEKLDSRLFYEKGNMQEAAEAVKWLCGLESEQIIELRRKAIGLAEKHLAPNYMEAFYSFVQRINELPRISRRRGPSWLKLLGFFSAEQRKRISEALRPG